MYRYAALTPRWTGRKGRGKEISTTPLIRNGKDEILTITHEQVRGGELHDAVPLPHLSGGEKKKGET